MVPTDSDSVAPLSCILTFEEYYDLSGSSRLKFEKLLKVISRRERVVAA
jgi:hypothetical protein